MCTFGQDLWKSPSLKGSLCLCLVLAKTVVVIHGHSWSLMVTRGHSWSLVVTHVYFRQDPSNDTKAMKVINNGFLEFKRTL